MRLLVLVGVLVSVLAIIVGEGKAGDIVGDNQYAATEQSISLDDLMLQSPPVSVKQNQSFPPIEVAQYAINGPTFGFFPGSGGKKAHYAFINGVRLDLRICDDIKALRRLVASGRHREVSGKPLPGGYISVYPEEVQRWAENISCGISDTIKDFFN